METHLRVRRNNKGKKPVQRTPVSTAAPDQTLQIQSDSDRILQMQHVVGNQNVMRMLSTSKTAQPTIQRAGAHFGLRTKGNISSFATEAVGFWKKTENKDKPLTSYSDYLLEKVNALLIAQCPAAYVTAGGDSGSFSRVTWDITINTAQFSTDPATDTVGKLTADEAAEVADTIYHEARHSQQYFTAAQIMAGEGSDATEIEASLSIPTAIADQAVSNPIKADKKNKDMIATVKDWQSIGAGIHATYKGLVNGFMGEASELYLDAQGVDDGTLDDKKSTLDTKLAEWKTNQLADFDSEVTRIEDMKKRSKGDNLVLSHAKKIAKHLKGVIDTWDKDTKRTVATVQKEAAKIKTLYTYVYAAYRDHLHEQDAWASGGAAGAEFRTLANKKKK